MDGRCHERQRMNAQFIIALDRKHRYPDFAFIVVDLLDHGTQCRPWKCKTRLGVDTIS